MLRRAAINRSVPLQLALSSSSSSSFPQHWAVTSSTTQSTTSKTFAIHTLAHATFQQLCSRGTATEITPSAMEIIKMRRRCCSNRREEEAMEMQRSRDESAWHRRAHCTCEFPQAAPGGVGIRCSPDTSTGAWTRIKFGFGIALGGHGRCSNLVEPGQWAPQAVK
jgi:hypothetical protein